MVRKLWLAVLFLAFTCVSAFAAGFDGKWTAQFETPMGTQKYTYEFHVDGSKLTGKAINDRGEVAIKDGKIDGDNITFVETLSIEGNELSIVYTGKIDGDKIKFVRKVGDFGTEELTATRVK